MAAFDPATLDRWRALAIVDRDGTTVGTISEFYLDRETGYPTWALVNTGLFGATQTFVPLVHATEISDGLQVPYEKNHIKDTPKVDLHDELSPTEEAELFAHYGVEYQPSPDTEPAEGSGEAGPGSDERSVGHGSAEGPVNSGPAGAGDPGSAEPPGPVRADAGSAGSPAVVGAGPGLVGSPAVAEGGPRASGSSAMAEGGSSVSGSPAGAGTEPGPSARPAVADGRPVTGDASGVPAEPAYPETGTPGPVGPGADVAATGRFGSGSEAVPEEPGTTDPDDATLVESQRSGPSAGGSDGSGPSAGHPQDQTDPDPALERSGTSDRNPGPVLERSGTVPPDLAPERSGTAGHDPDLARTAPVEPGLPGSTAASPYGPAPTVDKAAHPSGAPAEPPRAPDEAGWAPGAAGSFEEHEPFDRPAGASDRWHEAKLAAERDRIARAAASQPEERSPLERARRRLERLVGGGQDHPDPDPEISSADREAAERARRARLGLDEDDRRR
jgi:PRC-barrel domain